MAIEPRPAGPLAEILTRRRIAVGIDERQRLVLARPDSLLVRIGGSARRRDRIASWVDAWDRDQAQRIAAPDPERTLRFETVRFPAGYFDQSEPSLAGVAGTWRQLSADGHDVELNHVVLGAPALSTMLGASASNAGDVTLAAQAVKNADGAMVLRSTAQPATAPPFLRRAVEIPNRTRPKVLVMDSGLRTVGGVGEVPEHDELRSCFVHDPWLLRPDEREVDDEDEFDVDLTGALDFQAGHGTFISGIVRQICPDAEIYTCGVLTSFGEGSVSGVLHAVERVLALVGPVDVVVMSFGGYFTNDDPGLFGPELRRLLGNAIPIASAGNDGSTRPYFPAALPDVIGVGGLAVTGRAWFSNFGSWVDACAPAIDVVSTFFTGLTERLHGEPRRHFDGWARWSGTSFAAPKVAALIAEELYLDGGEPRDAWRRLTSHRQLRLGDLGIVFNV